MSYGLILKVIILTSSSKSSKLWFTCRLGLLSKLPFRLASFLYSSFLLLSSHSIQHHMYITNCHFKPLYHLCQPLNLKFEVVCLRSWQCFTIFFSHCESAKFINGKKKLCFLTHSLIDFSPVSIKPSITSNFNAKKSVLMAFAKIMSRRGKDTTRIKFIIRKILIQI